MKIWTHIDIWTRKATALFVVISMLFPMIAMAQVPQKPVLLSDEQEFLNQLHENIQTVIDHPNWHMDSNDLVLELDKNKNGKQIRFLLQNIKGSNDKLELFVQEKILGKRIYESPGYKRYIFDKSLDRWEYKFKKLPIGLADYSKSPTGYKRYVSSETLEEYLSTKRVAYQTDDGKIYDESGKITLTPAGLEKQKRKEADDRYTTAVMQCSAVVEHDDIRDRKLMTKVFSMDKVPHTFSQAELDAYEDQIEIGKLEKNSLENLSHRVLDISLHATITTWLAFYEIFKGKKTKDQWLQYFNNADYFSKFFIELPQFKNSIPKLIDKYEAVVQKNPFHLLSEEELKLAISSFNYQIKNINQSCKNAREELLHNIDVAPNKPMFSSQGMAQFADKMEREVSEKYSPLVDPFFQKIKSSQLSILFGSEDFRDDIGEFDISDCVTDGEGIHETNLDKVNEAIADIEKMYRTKLAGIILGYNDAFKAILVQNYIKSLPISVQLALNQKKSAHEVKVVCGLIDDIYEDDYFSKKVDQGLLGVGIIAAAMCGYAELGIPATFLAMSPINAAVVLRGRDKWNEGVALENQVSQALITGEMSHDMAMEDIKKHEDRQTEGMWDFFGTIGGESLGYVGGYIFKQGVTQGTRAVRYLKASKTRAAQRFFQAQDIAVIRSIESTLNTPKYSPLNQEKAFLILEEAKQTGSYDDAAQKLSQMNYDSMDIKNLIEQVSDLNDHKLIYETIEAIITQPKYVGKEAETLKTLHAVTKEGYVWEGSYGHFINSTKRQSAIDLAQKKLVEQLDFAEADAKKILDDLFNENTGKLRGKIHREDQAEYSRIEMPGTGSRATSVMENRGISETVDANKDVFKYKYESIEALVEVTEKFKNGGLLEFSNGKTFNIKRIFNNSGNQNVIFELETGNLLRVPKERYVSIDDSPLAFVEGQKSLEAKGVPVVKIIEFSNEYVVVEKLTNSRNIANYADYLKVRSELPELARQKLDAQFIEFAKKTARVEFMADFHPEQLVYSDRRGWVLVDINNIGLDYNRGNGLGTIFDSQLFSDKVPTEIREAAVKAVHDERRTLGLMPPENPPIASASATVGRAPTPSGRGRFVQNEDGQWVRLAKTEIVPAHAIQIKSLREQEELLWRKVGKVDQHIEEIEQIKDIGDIPVEIEETMKELQRERIHLEYEIKTINSHLVHRVKDHLEKYGIKSSLVKSDGMESLLINLKTDHPIHETVRKYLSRVTDEPLGYFSYEYNPFKLRQMMAGGAILNGNNFVMGMHTIERLVTNNLDSLEFHEIRHLFHAIRRKNKIPSIWDQRFKSPTDDLISIETYSKEYGVEEFDSYADEFKRASRDMYWATKETPRNVSRMVESLGQLEHHRFTLHQFSEASMKHSKEFYEAILHEKYMDYILDDDLKSITIRLRNGKAYVKYFVSEDEIKLFKQFKIARVMPDSPNFIFARQHMFNYSLGQLKELNRLSYLQTIDLLRIEHEFTQIRAILDHGDLSEPALNQLQAHIDKSMGLSQKTWFRDYQNEKAYGLTIQKAPESYFNDLWNDVIQDDQQVHAISIHLSQVFLEPTVAIHPKLLNLNIGERSIEIQKVLDKTEYRMLDPDKAIDILDDAKTSGNYNQGKIDLRAMGYLEEDARAMIKKIEGRSSDHTQHFASSVPLDLKDHSSAYKGFLEKIPSIKLTGNHFDELVEVAEKENIYVSQGVAGIVVRSSPSAVVKFTHSAQDLKRQIKAYNILKKNGYRVPLQLSKIRTIRNNYGQTIARVEFENINGISIAEIRTSRYRILGGSTDDIDQSVVGFSVVLEYEIALLTSLLKKNSLKFDDMRFYEDIIFTGEIDDLQRIGTRYYAKTISKKEVRDYLIQNLVWLDPVY